MLEHVIIQIISLYGGGIIYLRELKLSKYNTRYEYLTEKLADWLNDFANQQVKKLTSENNIEPQELKNAGYMDNILDIVNRNKKISVEEKVSKYRELVGLDLVENLEKEGGKEVIASRIVLSIRDKIAQNVNNDKQTMEQIRQYVDQIIKNRDGSIAMPAILEQLNNYLKIDKDWLRDHLEEIKKMIDNAKKRVESHRQQSEPSINDLARTDDPSRGEKEPPPFLPPAHSPT